MELKYILKNVKTLDDLKRICEENKDLVFDARRILPASSGTSTGEEDSSVYEIYFKNLVVDMDTETFKIDENHITVQLKDTDEPLFMGRLDDFKDAFWEQR